MKNNFCELNPKNRARNAFDRDNTSLSLAVVIFHAETENKKQGP